MKEKLILKHRGDFDYFLVSRTDNSEALVASLNPDGEFEYKLSKQNCDEIFGVIDVEEIADRHTFGQRNHEWKAYIAGFNKNAELNKDKVFTLEDLEKAYSQGELDALKTGSYSEKEKEFIQSLQQPTEIEVEIEMEVSDLAFYENGERYPIEANIPERFKYNPKLDSQGCLILKNI